jgi:predicted nucleic acid-binding protein
VLIAYLDSEDAQHARAESLLAREIDDEFAANPLTLAEVLVGLPGPAASMPHARRFGSLRS